MIESILSISFPAAFLAGVVTVFLPCTYPLCLGYLALIAGESSQGRRLRVLITTLWFFLGFGLIYTILGSAAGFFGQFTATTVFLSEIQSALVIFGGVFFIILGLVLLQVVPLPSVLKGLHSIRRTSDALIALFIRTFGRANFLGPLRIYLPYCHFSRKIQFLYATQGVFLLNSSRGVYTPRVFLFQIGCG